MLIEHRVDDMDEGFVAREQTVPPGQQIAFEPALAGMFTEDLHDLALGRQMVVLGRVSATQARSVTSNTAESRFEAVSSGPNRRKL